MWCLLQTPITHLVGNYYAGPGPEGVGKGEDTRQVEESRFKSVLWLQVVQHGIRDEMNFIENPMMPPWAADQLALYGIEAEAVMPSLAAQFAAGRDGISVSFSATDQEDGGGELEAVMATPAELKGRVFRENAGCATAIVVSRNSLSFPCPFPACFHDANCLFVSAFRSLTARCCDRQINTNPRMPARFHATLRSAGAEGAAAEGALPAWAHLPWGEPSPSALGELQSLLEGRSARKLFVETHHCPIDAEGGFEDWIGPGETR